MITYLENFYYYLHISAGIWWIWILPRSIFSDFIMSIFFSCMSFCKSQTNLFKLNNFELDSWIMFITWFLLLSYVRYSEFICFDNFYSCYILWAFCEQSNKIQQQKLDRKKLNQSNGQLTTGNNGNPQSTLKNKTAILNVQKILTKTWIKQKTLKINKLW